MNDSELFERASKAGYDYRTVYGKFPAKIGIHHRRMQGFPTQVVFPVIPEVKFPMSLPVSLAEFDSIKITQHICPFEPVAGPETHFDEVYLPHPDNDMKGISAARMTCMATEHKARAVSHE